MRVHPTQNPLLKSQKGRDDEGRRGPGRFLIALVVLLAVNAGVVAFYWDTLDHMVDVAGRGGRFLSPVPPGLEKKHEALDPDATGEAPDGAEQPAADNKKTAALSPAARAGKGDATASPDVPPAPDEGEVIPVAPNKELVGAIARNQSLAMALDRAGATPTHVHEVVSALDGLFDFRYSRAGDDFQLKLTPEGEVVRFRYERSPEEIYLVRREDDGLKGHRKEVLLERELHTFEGVIRTSLYDALADSGETQVLAGEIADIFAWSIDFYTDPRKGDRFRVTVEKVMLEGKFRRYGRILAARYDQVDGTHHDAYYYRDPSGDEGYYASDGASLRKTFLRSPMRFVHITSSYGKRFHPILGKYKKHNGVDYGAPTGTPIWSVADGRVTYAGWKGANGKLITIRHPNGYETAYAHLSRIDKSVKSGKSVKQKQVIGYVGTTGRSTGPHLHFAMKKGGRFVNPGQQKFPRGKAVPERHMTHFAEAITKFRSGLEAPYAALPEDKPVGPGPLQGINTLGKAPD